MISPVSTVNDWYHSAWNRIIQYVLFGYALLLVVLLLLTVSFNNNSFLIWGLVGASFLLLCYPAYLIPVYFIASIGQGYFGAIGGFELPTILGVVLIISGLLYITRHSQRFNKKNLVHLLLMSLYLLISSAFSLTGSFYAYFVFLQYTLIVIIFGQIRDVNLPILTKLLVISSVLTIIFLVFTLRENIILMHAERLTSGENVHANRFAMMLAQLSAVTFAASLIYRKNINKIFFVMTILVAYFMMILSFSRSAIIGLTATILTVILYLLQKDTKKYIFAFVSIVFLVISSIYAIQQIEIPFIERISVENIIETGGTGRTEIWSVLIPIGIENNLFFGYGWGPENTYRLAYQNGLYHPAHNFVFDMFLQIGIVGLALFFTYFVYVARNLKRYIYEPLILVPTLILLTAIFNGIGETIFGEKLFWNGIALAWLYMNNLYHNAHKSKSAPVWQNWTGA